MKERNRKNIGCVILAAGNAARFKENKLLSEIDGVSLIERAFASVPKKQLENVIVVTQYDQIRALADERGFQPVINCHPARGVSFSVKLGAETLKDDCDGILFLVADQPFLRRESVSGLIDCFRQHPHHIVSMSSGGKRGNPCVFPKDLFDELCSLSGDRGGRAVIERHEDRLILFEVSEKELLDIDTPQDLICNR